MSVPDPGDRHLPVFASNVTICELIPVLCASIAQFC